MLPRVIFKSLVPVARKGLLTSRTSVNTRQGRSNGWNYGKQ
jgi:hypothetical protein